MPGVGDQDVERIQHLLMDCRFCYQTWHTVLSWIRSTAPPPNPGNNFMDWWATSVLRLPQPWRALPGFECCYLDVVVSVCSSLGMYKAKAYANFHFQSMHQDVNFLCSLEREE